jgi:hypothetical protein
MLRVRPVMMLEVAFMLWRRFAVGLILLALIAGTAAILGGAQSQTVSGVVRDASGGPLSGAVVRERGSSAFVMTGSDGTFRLPVSGRDAQVTAWAPGHYVGGGRTAPASGHGQSGLRLHQPRTGHGQPERLRPLSPRAQRRKRRRDAGR